MPYKDPLKAKQSKHESYVRNMLRVKNRTIRQRIKAKNRNLRLILIDEYGGCCEGCNDPRVNNLDFHHRRFHVKTYTMSEMFQRNFCEEKIRAEAAKCILLCGDCHERYHKYEKVWVHLPKDDIEESRMLALYVPKSGPVPDKVREQMLKKGVILK